MRTVFVECHSQYRTDGPEELRPVGEVEWVASVAEEADRRGDGPPIAGIVGHADLTLGDAVQPVLEALDEAGRGRFRGVRHNTAWDASPMGEQRARPGCSPRRTSGTASARSVASTSRSTRWGTTRNSARSPTWPGACPDVRIVANHLGIPLGRRAVQGPAPMRCAPSGTPA